MVVDEVNETETYYYVIRLHSYYHTPYNSYRVHKCQYYQPDSNKLALDHINLSTTKTFFEYLWFIEKKYSLSGNKPI